VFNFRDAQQDGGWEDFMHVTDTAVTHAAHLSWFMVRVASRFLVMFASVIQPAPSSI
jgi:hypothetical protein